MDAIGALFELMATLVAGVFQLVAEFVFWAFGFAIRNSAPKTKEGEQRSIGAQLLIAFAPLIGLVLLIALVVVGLTVSSRAREEKIQRTRELVAGQLRQVASELDDDGRLIRREELLLEEKDAWDHQLTLAYRDGTLNETVEVRSGGPDGKSGSHDDIVSSRSIARTKTAVAKDLIGGAVKAIREKFAKD